MLKLAEPTGRAKPTGPAQPSEAAPTASSTPETPTAPETPAAWPVLPEPITAVLRRECLASVAEIRTAIQREVADL